MNRFLLMILPGIFTAAVAAPDAVEQQVLPRFADIPRLEIHPVKTRMYVGEVAALAVALVVEPSMVRNIQYPRLADAWFRMDAFSAPQQKVASADDGESVVFEFNTLLVPLKAGEYRLGPAEIGFDARAAASGASAFFGGGDFKSTRLYSAPVPLTVLDPPVRGRPVGFGGTVGEFSIMRRVDHGTSQVGNPVTVATRISGVGKFDTIECPVVTLPGVRAYPPVRRSSEKGVSCTQVIVPAVPGRLRIPPVGIAFFDPNREHYRTALTAEATLEISPPVDLPPAVQEPAIGVSADHRLAPTPAGFKWWKVALPAVITLALIALAGLVYRRRRVTDGQTDELPANADPAANHVSAWLATAENALARNDLENACTAAFRVLQHHIAARYGGHALSMTGNVASIAMRQVGVEQAEISMLTSYFDYLDSVRFGRTPPSADTLGKILDQLRAGAAVPRQPRSARNV